MNKPLAVYGLCNTAGLAIYAWEDDQVLVGLNDEEPEWLTLAWEDDTWGFFWGEQFVLLDDCLRV